MEWNETSLLNVVIESSCICEREIERHARTHSEWRGAQAWKYSHGNLGLFSSSFSCSFASFLPPITGGRYTISCRRRRKWQEPSHVTVRLFLL